MLEYPRGKPLLKEFVQQFSIARIVLYYSCRLEALLP